MSEVTYSLLIEDSIDSEQDLAALAEVGAAEIGDLEVSESPSPDAVDPITAVIVVSVAVMALAKLIAWIINRIRGGLEINLGSSPVKITRNREIDHGLVIIVAKDGSSVELKTVELPKDELDRLLATLLSQPGESTLETVKKAIEKALPQQKEDAPAEA